MLYGVRREECTVTVAIDMAGRRSARRSRIPNAFDAVFNTFQIMQGSIMSEKVARDPPDILIRPDIADVLMFDLFKARRINHATEPAKAALRRALKRVLKYALQTQKHSRASVVMRDQSAARADLNECRFLTIRKGEWASPVRVWQIW